MTRLTRLGLALIVLTASGCASLGIYKDPNGKYYRDPGRAQVERQIKKLTRHSQGKIPHLSDVIQALH